MLLPAMFQLNHSPFPSIEPALAAGLRSPDEDESRRAMEDVCAQYYYPLYCFIRRQGLDHHDTQDALHDFFAKLLRTNALARADEEKGGVRALLLISLRRYLISWHRSRRFSLREVELEEAAALAMPDSRSWTDGFWQAETPARTLERKCARTTLGNALRQLHAEYTRRGKEVLFAALRPVLLSSGSLRGSDTRTLARELGMTSGALRVAFCRLLQDFRQILEHELRITAAGPGEAQEDLARMRGLFVGQ